MADSATTQVFPTEDALCEQCGYPLKGLASDVSCPECGYAISDSSPINRTGPAIENRPSPRSFLATAFQALVRPNRFYRTLRKDPNSLLPLVFLAIVCITCSVVWLLVMRAIGFVVIPGLMPFWGLAVLSGVFALTMIEAMGVGAFSARKQWRVPFELALRVCCYASVAWLPSVLLAAVGFSLLQVHAVGQPWFEQLLGLVRVGWLVYAALFFLSLLWFETLVWIGVRQVKYANAWPEKAYPEHTDL